MAHGRGDGCRVIVGSDWAVGAGLGPSVRLGRSRRHLAIDPGNGMVFASHPARPIALGSLGLGVDRIRHGCHPTARRSGRGACPGYGQLDALAREHPQSPCDGGGRRSASALVVLDRPPSMVDTCQPPPAWTPVGQHLPCGIFAPVPGLTLDASLEVGCPLSPATPPPHGWGSSIFLPPRRMPQRPMPVGQPTSYR